MKHPLKITIISLCLLCSFKLNAQVDKLIKQLHNPNDKKILVAAHRGDWRNAPENSLEAYKRAIEMGVDIIEVDLNITRDGVLVIMHDPTIDRTTDGRGKPSDYTLEQLKKFHLRDGLRVPGKLSIPTLEEVMLLAKGKVLVNLDRSYEYFNQAFEVLKRTGTVNQAIFKTEELYKTVRLRYPTVLDSITFMSIVDLDTAGAADIINEYQKAIKPVAFELIFGKDTSSILADNAFVKAGGSKIWINALWPRLCGGHDDNLASDEANTKDSWDWLIEHGATIIQTDRPKELLAYLRKRSLHRRH